MILPVIEIEMSTTAITERSRALIILLAASLLCFPLMERDADGSQADVGSPAHYALRSRPSHETISKRKSTPTGSTQLGFNRAVSELDPDEPEAAVHSDDFSFHYDLSAHVDPHSASRRPFVERRVKVPTRLVRLEILIC